MTTSGMSTSEGQHRWDGLERKHERLSWYGHARRKDDGHIGKRMLRMELSGKRKRGRRKGMFMDVMKVDMSGKPQIENPLWQPLMGKPKEVSINTNPTKFGFKRKHGTDQCIYVLNEIIDCIEDLMAVLCMFPGC